MTEIWRTVVGFEGVFEVSSMGSVRRARDGYMMKSRPASRYGHLKINLKHRGRNKTCLVHRLVAAAFIGVCPAGMEVRHLDGTASNNAISNIRYGTRRQNADDRVKHGNSCVGVRNGRAKLNGSVGALIAELRAKGLVQWQIGERLGVSQSTISKTERGERWAPP